MTTTRTRNALTGLLVLVLGLLAGWTVLAADDGGPTTARVAGQEEPTEASTSELATDAETEPAPAAPLISYDVFLARDPFEPVVPEPADGGGDGSTPGTVPGVVNGGTPSPGTPSPTASPSPGSTATPSPTDEGCSRGSSIVCNGVTVSLLDITTADDGTRTAVVQVGSTVYEVQDGDRFASNFLVNSITSDCVGMLFGDDNFVLCIGEQVLK